MLRWSSSPAFFGHIETSSDIQQKNFLKHVVSIRPATGMRDYSTTTELQ